MKYKERSLERIGLLWITHWTGGHYKNGKGDPVSKKEIDYILNESVRLGINFSYTSDKHTVNVICGRIDECEYDLPKGLKIASMLLEFALSKNISCSFGDGHGRVEGGWGVSAGPTVSFYENCDKDADVFFDKIDSMLLDFYSTEDKGREDVK